MKKKAWFYIAISCVGISILSLFFSIITYRGTYGVKYSFSIVDLLIHTEKFEDQVLNQYNGPVVWDITGTITVALVVIAVFGILCSIIGLFTLRAQRPNTWQFILTITGLICVAVPSVVLIVCVVGYGKYYHGTLGFGVAPIITPIAMVLCIATVIRRKNRVAEELRRELEAKGLIRRAGDLQ